jgi:hypothetical protein
MVVLGVGAMGLSLMGKGGIAMYRAVKTGNAFKQAEQMGKYY